MIRQGLWYKLVRRAGQVLLNLKDLIAIFPPSCRPTVSGLVGRVKRGDYLLILRWLLAKLVSRIHEGLLNLKDLLAAFPPSCQEVVSGLVARVKSGEADMLIRQGLLSNLLRKTGKGVLNLKDLLTASPPRLSGLFENELVLRCCLATKSYQILPFSTKNVQRTGLNMAQKVAEMVHHVAAQNPLAHVADCHSRERACSATGCGRRKPYGKSKSEVICGLVFGVTL